MNALETALYNTLSGGTALTALLAGGTAAPSIYNQQAPDEAAFPYVVFALQGGGDENSHRDFRAISAVLDRLKNAGEGRAVFIIHHVRKNAGDGAGVDEVRGAGFSGYADAIVRLYKRRGSAGAHYEMKFDLRNYEERDDLILTRLGPIFEVAPPEAGADVWHVVKVLQAAGGVIHGRGKVVGELMALTGLKEQTCINAIGRALASRRVRSTKREGKKEFTYYLGDDPDEGGA